jgi:hypothetical protein
LLAAVKLLSIVDNAVKVAVFAGQYDGPAGGADGIGAEAVGKTHTLVSDSVEIGRLIDFAAVTAQGMRSMVIRHYKYNVRLFL